MKRWLLWTLVAIGIALVLVLAVGLVAVSTVAGGAKDSLAATLGERLGVEVSIAAAHVDLSQCLRLRPAISLEGVAAGNPAGFRTPRLLAAEGISAQAELWPLLRKTLRIRSITIRR